MVLFTHKSTAKCAGQGFARQGSGAAWQSKNKDPSRLKLVSWISSVCFYNHPPARPLRNRLSHNSKAGVIIFYFNALPTNNVHMPFVLPHSKFLLLIFLQYPRPPIRFYFWYHCSAVVPLATALRALNGSIEMRFFWL